MIAFLIFSAIVGAVVVKVNAQNARVRLETNHSVLEHRLAVRRLDDAREQRLLASHGDE